MNEPSAASVAAAPLTVTVATGSPLGPGVAVPVTVICPVPLWIMLRAGDVTVKIGGGACPPQATVVAASTRPIDIEWAVRMGAWSLFSKRRAIRPAAGSQPMRGVASQ